MELKIHPKFFAWIDGESVRIAGFVQDLSDRVPTRATLPKDLDLPVAATIAPHEIIGQPIISQADAIGTIITRFFPHEGKWHGLTGDGMREARALAERIWKKPELRDRISHQSVDELVLEWVGDTACGHKPDSLSVKIDRFVVENVKPLSVIVPIDELHIDEEFSFATATIIPLSRLALEEIVNIGASKRPPEAIVILQDDLCRKWLGKAGMRFELIAEPQRAHEIAFQRASDYMALLQFYGAPPLILPLTSHVAPTGTRPYRASDYLAYAPDVFRRTKPVSEPTYQLLLTAIHRSHAERHGLMTLSCLAQHAPCDYEQKLLQSLLVYGRACYQVDPTDKLLQVMTAMEMFALRSDSEPIQAAVGDRLAFAITTDATERQQIVHDFRKTYKLRSGRSHHGKTISEAETIERFLGNVWVFFLNAIRGVGRYRTREQFLDYLDQLKYGHQNPT
jgi:hypothetical protein